MFFLRIFLKHNFAHYMIIKSFLKLPSWSGNFFSAGDKEILIKAIVQSIPVYSMNLFRIPVSFIRDLHRMAANFWWGNSLSKKSIHWCSWESLCLSKDAGGI
ncbi:hypothetical protein ACOSP7_009693 [Xanthoceras sorbifolium]